MDEFEHLGKVLYERMEHLDPSPDKFVEWDALDDHKKEFYRCCAESVALADRGAQRRTASHE